MFLIIIGVQINSMLLSLINLFLIRKFITDNEKWILYNNFERKISWIESIIDIDREYSKKVLVCRGKSIELICSPNK